MHRIDTDNEGYGAGLCLRPLFWGVFSPDPIHPPEPTERHGRAERR